MVPLKASMVTGDWKELPADKGLGKQFGERMGTVWEASQPGSRLQFKLRVNYVDSLIDVKLAKAFCRIKMNQR
jgi:hypothetical protein